jgi:hypothetical protein
MARRKRDSSYDPGQHLPLLAFTLAAAPLFATRLLQFDNSFATFLGAMTAFFAVLAITTGIFAHWRHTVR